MQQHDLALLLIELSGGGQWKPLAACWPEPCWSEPGRLADQDDVDAAGEFRVDLEDLPDVAVLPVRGDRAAVFEHQAMTSTPSLVIACALPRP